MEARLRDQRRERTRHRLIAAGLRLFEEQGYDATTAAEIAAAAGVTERTFFRHFRTKADLVLAGWRSHTAVAAEAMRSQPKGAPLLEVARAGGAAFATRLTTVMDGRPEISMEVFAHRLPALEMLAMMVVLEATIARELASRSGRSEEDVPVRVAANATVGVLRACGRAHLQRRDQPLGEAIDNEMRTLAPLFASIEAGT